ncbi:hypothetical protein [Paraflavitalea speifideaquila]|uniref:hypothetical protein n=1 Tax=Paraflavitalea speifideaquila TaxID=3076558 RepID=UPI0028ED69DA|nr:hypothetical protein [Paraflavitalea speifideiaquila]
MLPYESVFKTTFRKITSFTNSEFDYILLNSTAKERYEQFLQQYPTLTQRLPKTLIAAYLGVSRETLSRLYTV